jgi:hypothetical protein
MIGTYSGHELCICELGARISVRSLAEYQYLKIRLTVSTKLLTLKWLLDEGCLKSKHDSVTFIWTVVE